MYTLIILVLYLPTQVSFFKFNLFFLNFLPTYTGPNSGALFKSEAPSTPVDESPTHHQPPLRQEQGGDRAEGVGQVGHASLHQTAGEHHQL